MNLAPPISTQSAWRPLGKGYEGFQEFFSRYCAASNDPNSNPELATGLNSFRNTEAKELIGRIGARPVCLIQGITCPRNGLSLRQFLSESGAEEPEIHGIDIMDVEAIARESGTELTHVSFAVGDAAGMHAWANGTVDVLVQDHLLNCAPHGSHEAILAEAARVLSPTGVMIFNVSVDPEAQNTRLSWCEAQRLLGTQLSDEAYCLRDIVGDERVEELRSRFAGKLIAHGSQRRELLVTHPYGNFEFYRPWDTIEQALERAGLRLILINPVPGTHCVRYRTLVERIPENLGSCTKRL